MPNFALKHLWEMDMGLIIKTEYIAKDGLLFKGKPVEDGIKFGYLPKMVTTSKGLIGSLKNHEQFPGWEGGREVVGWRI